MNTFYQTGQMVLTFLAICLQLVQETSRQYFCEKMMTKFSIHLRMLQESLILKSCVGRYSLSK